MGELSDEILHSMASRQTAIVKGDLGPRMARELIDARAELSRLRREVAELRPIARSYDEQWHREIDR